MRPVPAFIFVALISLGVAQDTTTAGINDNINAVEPKPSVRLDPYIRKALLKALSELEDSETSTTDDDISETSTMNTEEISKTLQPPLPNEEIKIHSFVVNGQAAFANSTNITPTIIDSKISILSTTAGNVENYVTATLPTQTPFNEIFQTRESVANFQQVRSIKTSSNQDTKNSLIKKESIFKPAPTTTTTSTTTTTTTTTPKPTHNDDGENIEEVDKRDVQVFQAPLVAAFTVQQDAQGLPKKVIPIYQQSNVEETLKSQPATNFPTGVLPPQISGPQIIPSIPIANRIPPSDFVSQQLALQRQLEEKQRILEEQLRLLQLQQRQQEELLRKQQLLLQQKEAQRQQQILFEQEQLKRQSIFSEQQKLPVNGNNNFQVQGLPKQNQQNNFLNQNNGIRQQSSQVSILPSVPLVENSQTVPSHQQLPNREAVDFLLHLRNQQPEQFPLQENHLPQGISNFLQPNPVNLQQANSLNFHQGPNANQLRGGEQFGQKHGNRVFRQESGVGNFGLNNQNQNYNNQIQNYNNQNQNYNRFNTFNPIYTNRFFPSNRFHQFSPDAELKQLLYQTGLNTRGQEDLNIVSKVLSLNHGIAINNNVSNRLPFDSRRHVRTPL